MSSKGYDFPKGHFPLRIQPSPGNKLPPAFRLGVGLEAAGEIDVKVGIWSSYLDILSIVRGVTCFMHVDVLLQLEQAPEDHGLYWKISTWKMNWSMSILFQATSQWYRMSMDESWWRFSEFRNGYLPKVLNYSLLNNIPQSEGWHTCFVLVVTGSSHSICFNVISQVVLNHQLPLNPAFCHSTQLFVLHYKLQIVVAAVSGCVVCRKTRLGFVDIRRWRQLDASWEMSMGGEWSFWCLDVASFSGTITVSSIQVLCGRTEHYCWSHISLPLAIDASTLDLPNPVKQEFVNT